MVLGGVEFLFEFGELFAKLVNFVFAAEDAFGAGRGFGLEFLLGFLAFLDLGKKHVELVTG